MEDSLENIFNLLIRDRKLLVPGKGNVPDYSNGTKVTFHFKTEAIYSNGDEKIIDDSKSSNKPMELFIGKKFKFPLWEEWIKHMRLGEISQLSYNWSLCKDVYPLLSKSYRNFANPTDHDSRTKRSHCCGMAKDAGTGHKDLDDLLINPPEKLRFTIELMNVENPNDIDQEIWLMSEKEMQENVPLLQKEGNKLFSEKKYEDASLKYRKALAILEQLMTREKPGDEDWLNYDLAKIPLLSNLAQCELFMHQYYNVIRHTDEVLEKDSKNIKALYRRAKAHLAVWNIEQARKDFQQVSQLDKTLSSTIKQHLIDLEQQVKLKEREDMELLKGKLF